jgi:tetratricopeptide (TPR) repeat protein
MFGRPRPRCAAPARTAVALAPATLVAVALTLAARARVALAPAALVRVALAAITFAPPTLPPVTLAVVTLTLAATGAVLAKEGLEEEAAALDPSYVAAQDAIRERRYAEARRLLGEALARDGQNADTHNLLGFAYRKTGNLEAAFRHYQEALRLNPDHRGAHEYIGEAYLAAENLDKAEDHLRVLERLCQSPCEEQTDLRTAIDAYKARRAPPGIQRGAR